MVVKTYVYSSFELNVYIHEDIEEVDSIVILGNSLKTNRGIRIGDPEEVILTNYGQTKKVDGVYKYELESNKLKTANYGIRFHVDKEKIQKIVIYQASIL